MRISRRIRKVRLYRGINFGFYLHRLVSGIRKRTLIINFPGSPKACSQCIDVVKPVIKHAIDLLRGSHQANVLHDAMIKLESKVVPSGLTLNLKI